MTQLTKTSTERAFQNAIDRSAVHIRISVLNNQEQDAVREAFVRSTGIFIPEELSTFTNQLLVFKADEAMLVGGTSERSARTVFDKVRLVRATEMLMNEKDEIETNLSFERIFMDDRENPFQYDRLTVRTLPTDYKMNLQKPSAFYVVPVKTEIREEERIDDKTSFLFLKRIIPVSIARYISVTFAHMIASLSSESKDIDEVKRFVLKEIDTMIKGAGLCFVQAKSNLLRRNIVHQGTTTFEFCVLQSDKYSRKMLKSSLVDLGIAVKNSSDVQEIVNLMCSFDKRLLVKRHQDWFYTALHTPEQILLRAI